MKNLLLNPRGLAFIVSTRAALAAGAGLLAADVLAPRSRRALGAALVTLGAATTLPAVLTVVRGARRARRTEYGYGDSGQQVSRFPRKGDDIQPEPAEWLFDEAF